MFTVRLAQPSDAAPISEIVCTLADSLLVDPGGVDAQNFYAVMQPAKVAANLIKSDRFYLVAEKEGVVVGMILILNNNYIGQFFVSRAHQGKGIGSALWAAALSQATNGGGTGTFTVKSSIAAVPIYQRFGFEQSAAPSVDSGFRYIPMHREAPTAI